VIWEDHRNDLFINSFGDFSRRRCAGSYIDVLCSGLLMSAGGSKLAWCMPSCLFFRVFAFGNTRNLDLDPTGAILVSDVSHRWPTVTHLYTDCSCSYRGVESHRILSV